MKQDVAKAETESLEKQTKALKETAKKADQQRAAMAKKAKEQAKLAE